MFDISSIIGQWAGHFEFGPEYREELHGEIVQFRLYIDVCIDCKFKGVSVDLEGIGANLESATLKGLVDGNHISYRKQYPHYYEIDEDGNIFHDKEEEHPEILYEGEFNEFSKSFNGYWQLKGSIFLIDDNLVEDICTGKWAMHKDD